MNRRRHTSAPREVTRPSVSEPLPVRHVFAVTVLFLAAWSAAGSIGLLAHPLRHAVTWLGLGLALLTGWPAARPGVLGWIGLLASLAAAAAATAAPDHAVNILAVPFVAGWLSLGSRSQARRIFCAAAFSAATLALYTLLRLSIPAVWLMADRLGHLLGVAAGVLAQRPLNVGATFAGIDMAVLMLGWLIASALHTRPPFLRRALYGAGGIVAAQLTYLILLAFAADWLSLFPKADPARADPVWLSALRWAVPWHLPLIAALVQCAVVAATMRWSDWREDDAPGPALGLRRRLLEPAAMAVLAVLLGLSASLCTGQATFQGKKIVIYEKGYLNWLLPKHEDYGRLSIGMYGLLPHFIRGLGASCAVSPELSADDLKDASVLVLIYPDKPWENGQLERLRDFVARGGSLWLFGEHTVREKAGGARFNDVLEPTAMRVQFDSATFAIGGWLHSFDALAHPATLGVPDDRNQFGLVIGASLGVSWPARPMIVGRWGWSDGGDPGHASMMGNDRYDAGEKLGDIILAAEQAFGKGRIVVFGDTSGISNGINIAGHEFNARMLAYLAGGMAGPQAAWRGIVAVLLAALLLFLAARRAAGGLLVAAAALVAVRMACTAATLHSMTVYPGPDPAGGYELAYIDAGHLGVYSSESWRDDGLMGLCLNLMRNGYLAFTADDLSPRRLAPAKLLLSVAPGRAYSTAERRAIREFVEGGGTFIITVGTDEKGPSALLLRELGLEVGDGTRAIGPATGPLPMGFFKAPYYDLGDYMVYVRFHAAWPVHGISGDAKPMAYGAANLPTILVRPVGNGKVILVGDTCFAMNKNLEIESGAPFEGMRENPHFWRWLFTRVRNQPLWAPPNPKAAQEAASGTQGPVEGGP